MRLAAGQPTRPYKLTDLTVGNPFRIRFRTLDETGTELETATSGRYRIDNLSNLVTVLGWTTFTPTNPVVITVPASLNVMSYNGFDTQTNQVTIELTYADGRKQLETRIYRLFQVYNAQALGVVP